MVYNWYGVVSSNDTAGLQLHSKGRCPGAMDVLLRVLSQLWEVQPDVLSRWVYKLSVFDWVMVRYRAINKGTATRLHPVATADSGLKIKQVMLKGLQSMDPGHPEVTSGEKASHKFPTGGRRGIHIGLGGARTMAKRTATIIFTHHIRYSYTSTHTQHTLHNKDVT